MVYSLTLPGSPARKFYIRATQEPLKSMAVPEVRQYVRRYIFAYTAVLILGVGIIVIHFVILSPPSPLLPIGGTFIASGVIGFAHYYHYRRERRIDYVRDLVDEWGLLDIHEGRGRAEEERYRRLMRGCDEKLYIQAITLTRFQEDLGGELERLGAQEVDIKLLLLDPDSEMCDWYSDANPGRSGLKSQIRESAEQLQAREINSLEVRFYNSIPLNYFQIDDKVFLGPYFTSRSSRRSVTFLAEVNKALAQGFKEDFHEHWNVHGRPIESAE